MDFFETAAAESFSDIGSAENKFVFLCSCPAVALVAMQYCRMGDVRLEYAATKVRWFFSVIRHRLEIYAKFASLSHSVFSLQTDFVHSAID
jgi:hypothetical protein